MANDVRAGEVATIDERAALRNLWSVVLEPAWLLLPLPCNDVRSRVVAGQERSSWPWQRGEARRSC
jgi:hypothetical protein